MSSLFSSTVHKISSPSQTSCGLRWTEDNRDNSLGGIVYIDEGDYQGPQKATSNIEHITCELCCLIEDVEPPPQTPAIRKDSAVIKKKALSKQKADSSNLPEPIPCGYHMYEEDCDPPSLQSYGDEDNTLYLVACPHCGLVSPPQSTPELALTVWEQLSLAINLGIDEETIEAIDIPKAYSYLPHFLSRSKPKSSKTSTSDDSESRKRGRKSSISDDELDTAYETLKDFEPDGDGKSDILQETGVDSRLWQKTVTRLLEDGVWKSEGVKRGTKYYAN